MRRKVSLYLLLTGLTSLLTLISGCNNAFFERDTRVSKASDAASALKSSSQGEPQMHTGVRLQVHNQTEKEVIFKLENDTNQDIYLSYEPLKSRDDFFFLAHSIERRLRANEFASFGPQLHFGPTPNPLKSHASILFKLFRMPEEKGEYRIRASYLSDPDVFRLIIERYPNLTDAELAWVIQSWKDIWSDSFVIR